jgi:IS605 OrfB family transposase
MIKTIKIPIGFSKQLKTQAQFYAQAYNHVVSFGLDNGIRNGVELHHKTYYPLRELLPNLPSQFIISARSKAAETITSWLSHKKKRDKQIIKQQEMLAKGKHIRRLLKPISRPVSKGLTAVRYDARTFTIDFKNQVISFSTVCGRQRIKFNANPYYAQYYSGKVCSADLCWSKKHNNFFFHVVLEFSDPILPEPSKVLGVDLGFNNLAVSSDGKFYMKHSVRDHVAKLRGLKSRLQSKDTPSSIWHLKAVSKKEHLFRRDVNHCVTKQIVRSAKVGGYDTIAIEDLTNIRDGSRDKSKEFRARMSSWPFEQFREFLTYKANAEGIAVSVVSPKYTSQSCSRCGNIRKVQRRGNDFHCVSCGYRNHADLNASYNISKNGLPEVLTKILGTLRHDCRVRASVQQAQCNGRAVAMPLRVNYKPTTLVVGG